MAESIVINSSQEIEYNIRPIINLYEFEYGLFSEKFNVYFNDKTDTSNPFLASVEITNSLGQKRWINYKPYTSETVQLGYVDKNKILYSNVFAPNIDVEYEILNGQLKENIILNSPTTLRQFEFTLKLSEFVEYELNENGDIIFTDSITTEQLWKIPAPNMVDDIGNESRNLYYSFENRDGYLSIIVNVNDEELLNSANTIYPIYIDPTTVYDDNLMAINLGKKTTVRDSFGNLYIVFSRPVSSYQRIMIRRILTNNTVQYWNGSAFVSSGGTETRIDTNSGNYNQTVPSIAIDSLNNIHIVWTGRSTGISTDQICYRKATYNSGNGTYSWDAQVQISTGIDTKTQYSAHLAVDNLNNIHVVWSGQDNTNTISQIKYRRYANSTWTTWENINVISSKSQSTPHIAIDSQNNVHLVYFGADATYANDQIKYSKLLYNSGNWGSWSNDTGTDMYNNISPVSGYAQSAPFICIDRNDLPHVVWYGTDVNHTSFNQIKYSYFNGSIWSPWVNIPQHSSNQPFPTMIIDNSNNIHVVWQGYDDINTLKQQIKYSKKIYNGTGWNNWTDWINLTNGADLIEYNYPRISYNNAQMDLVYHNNNDWTLLYENITPVPPATPTLLTATVQSSSRILWSWTDNSSDEVNFKIKDGSGNIITANLFLSDGTTPISNGLIPPNTTSIIEKSLTANTLYTRRIVATNDNGDSPYDEEPATTRALPTFNNFTGTKNGLNNLTWTINKT